MSHSKSSTVSLVQRILWRVLAISTLMLTAVVTIQAIQNSQLAKKEAFEKSRIEAKGTALRLQRELEKPLVLSNQLRMAIEGLWKLPAPDRAAASAVIVKMLEGNPDVLGLYTAWEPNVFDKKDADFSGKEGTDATGRFIPYFNRGAGKILVEPLLDYEDPVKGEYYQRPKKSGEECIIDPYIYPVAGKDMLIASFVVPIVADGKFVGIAGADLPLDFLQKIISEVRPYEIGYATLVANNGVFVADRDAGNVNKDVGDDANAKKIKEAVKKGESFELDEVDAATGKRFHRFFLPITLGKSTTPWTLGLSVPVDALTVESNRIVKNGIFVAICGLIVSTIFVYLALRKVRNELTEISDTLGSTSREVAAAATQTSASSQSLAEGASEQAASLEETSASIEELASMTKRNAENAQTAKQSAQETRSAADDGLVEMKEMSEALDEIHHASDNIAKIIKTIDEIAFQTNILALNAAVEAARAGEAGMGFAVVADEVRNLAQRSAQAAKETQQRIEDCIQKSEQGVQIRTRVTERFEKIVTKAREVDELVAEIATASREQSQGIDQVSVALNQMDKVTQSTAASSEEGAAAAEELSAQAHTLMEAAHSLESLVNGSAKAGEVPPPVTAAPKRSHKSNGFSPTPYKAKRETSVRASHNELTF